MLYLVIVNKVYFLYNLKKKKHKHRNINWILNNEHLYKIIYIFLGVYSYKLY